MNEREKFIVEELITLGTTEKGAEIIQRDLGLSYEGKTFVLSVGTPNYLETIRNYNKAFGPDVQIDENVLVLEAVDKIEDVIESLAKLEPHQVLPYLVEQKEQ